MERVCFQLRVRPDRLEEYQARHAAVWPAMLHALAEHGWHNYSLFLRCPLVEVRAQRASKPRASRS